MSKPRLLTYYITTACNARCSFCTIWQQPPVFADKNDVIRNCRDARRLGTRFVDFTGGEPLLYKALPEILVEAKKMGYFTSITTNTLLYPQRAEELKNNVDFLLFSIDGMQEYHDRNRGTPCFNSLIESIELALSIKKKPELLFTVTNESIAFLDDIYAFARSYNVMLLLNPVFDYFGIKGLTRDHCTRLRLFGKKRGVFVNTALLQLIENGGNDIAHPRCKAMDAVIVISPENTLLYPCYHHAQGSCPINDDLITCRKDVYTQYAQMQGRYPECQNCTINCYFDPSFEYQMDRFMTKSLVSRMKYALDRYIMLPLQSSKHGGTTCSR